MRSRARNEHERDYAAEGSPFLANTAITSRLKLQAHAGRTVQVGSVAEVLATVGPREADA